MDEIKASPRHKYLGVLSDLLRKGSEGIRPFEPTAAPLVSDFLGSLGKGTEGWAYGDRLLGPPAGAPMVTDKSLDMLGALPLGAAGKGAALGAGALGAKGLALAQLVPARPLLNADPIAAARLATRIKKADDAVVEGAMPEDIWHDFKLLKSPGLAHPQMTGKVGDKLHHARWMEEIDPENAIRRDFDPTQVGLSYANQVFDSPELFRQYPKLGDIQFEVTPGMKQGVLGQFDPNKSEFGRILVPSTAPDFRGTASHELSHGVMNQFKQANSYGHGASRVTPENRITIEDMSHLLRDEDPTRKYYGKVPEFMNDFVFLPNGATRNRAGGWDMSSGEALAEAVRSRTKMHPEARKVVSPAEHFPQDSSKLHNDQVITRAAQIAQSEGSLDQKTSALVRMLRTFGVVPQ